MAGRRMFEGRLHVHYGQAYVRAGGVSPELPEAFAGQENGLCGAAVPGSLFLITGLHTGDVGFAVEAALVEWGEADGTRLDIRPGDWRVRYSASGMDAAHDQTLLDGEPPIDHYLLQVWLAAPASDRPEAIRAQRPDPGSASVEDIRARVNDWYGALPGRWARVVDRSCGTIS